MRRGFMHKWIYTYLFTLLSCVCFQSSIFLLRHREAVHVRALHPFFRKRKLILKATKAWNRFRYSTTRFDAVTPSYPWILGDIISCRVGVLWTSQMFPLCVCVHVRLACAQSHHLGLAVLIYLSFLFTLFPLSSSSVAAWKCSTCGESLSASPHQTHGTGSGPA